MFNGMCFVKNLLVFLSLFVGECVAAQTSARVEFAIGDVSHIRYGQDKENVLRVGTKIFKGDRVLTAEEALVRIKLLDGSIVEVAENSEVLIRDLADEKTQQTVIDVKKGSVSFDVQKQKKENSFKFNTGTAVAAIRGTQGVVNADPFFAGLKTGTLDVESDGKTTASIKAGQTAVKLENMEVIDFVSSGEPGFVKELVRILREQKLNREELLKRVREREKAYREEVIKRQGDKLAEEKAAREKKFGKLKKQER